MTITTRADPSIETFERAGQMLHGEAWRLPLSRDLDVGERSVRRWANGESPIPEGIWSELRTLLTAHSAAARDLAKELPR